jgi:CheY-like chemotaxis protein
MNPTLYRKRLLVVEDQHLMRELTIEALNSVGFSEIMEAENGARALQLIAKHPVDVIIADIEMAPVDGFELAKQVRMGKTPLARSAPIIFLTGLSDTGTVAHAAELNVQIFVVKPVSALMLLEKVIKALEMPTLLRPATEYARFDRNRQPGTGAETSADAAVAASTPAHESHEIDVLMLSEGMLLLEDIKARGRIMLKKGTRLCEGHILIVQDMRGLLDKRQFLVTDIPSGDQTGSN